MSKVCLGLGGALLLCACGGEAPVDPQTQALLGVKSYVSQELGALHDAALALKAAAPTPDADGWSPAGDRVAVEAMRNQWKRMRVSYERVEGAIAVLFPNLDVATDERYDGFLEEGPDSDLFDDEGVIGVHAVERILWADSIPPEVVRFESSLTGYSTAAFPRTVEEATRFRDRLLARLERDTKQMEDDFAPLALDPAAAYRGVIGSMEEQLEKTNLAQSGESESRYAEHTLADMRANREGGEAIYRQFQPWLTGQGGGVALDQEINAGFASVAAAYAAVSGEGMPPVPAGWNPDAPTSEHLSTEYGRLWSLLSSESDAANPSSLVSKMARGAALLGIPELP